MALSPNPYQRHNFSNWYAFWDEEYVEAVRTEIDDSALENLKLQSAGHAPIMVMYMQWKDPSNPSPMYTMLSERLRCVIDKPGYSIYVAK